MKDKSFIVPHDFTEVANIALEHAIATARTLNARVYVLHVVNKNKDIRAAEEKLTEIISMQRGGVELVPSVRVGNIFEDIGDFAAEHHAELIFMGTHGTHGWQHVTGMNALKVITHSSVPFVVVQARTPKETGYDDIVVPLDLNKETKQKLAIVANIARYFNSKVHVITPEESDEFLRHQVKANIQFAQKYFSERSIEVTTTIVPSSGFDKEVVKHAVNIDADLIAIMNLNKSRMFGVLSANHEEYIITNDAQIPALIMNPIEGVNTLAVDFNG
jgi:nucleotide-binding universal stress UspA family protein